MPGIFGDNFLSLLSPLATAQYRPTPSATFPNPPAPAPGPLAIPPATPPIFLSRPDQSGAAPAQPPGALGSLGQGLANGINNHALTLMALGAGIAQGGVGRGLDAATAAAQAERNLQAQQSNFLQTYQALSDAGVPADVARAAVTNPNLMRAVAVKYLGSRAQSAAPGAPAVPAASGASNASPASAWAPALPPNVKQGAYYSPVRNMWRDQGGNRFDLQGKAVV
jgi:hypothetical protein